MSDPAPVPFFSDDWLTLYGGDCRTVLAGLPADSVDCVVTSPPYWGLRDYGTATWDGGDAACDHIERTMRPSAKSTLEDHGPDGRSPQLDSLPGVPFKDACGKCGATRIDSQLGLERTPDEYVANMVEVFREVRRVLKPSGTCWLNLGDSYASSPPGNTTKGVSASSTLHGVNGDSGRYRETLDAGHATKRNTVVGGLKPKDLVGIPWRVAFALQADGWYLRSDIIWSKPNPMPESVTDRPTKAHEYLFLLTKSARYYFDADAVRETASNGTHGGAWGGSGKHGAARNDGDSHSLGNTLPSGNRNIRSVWSIATRPYPGAHFAVFPPELPERCIKAGSSEKGVCPECGAPWERVVERVLVNTDGWGKATKDHHETQGSDAIARNGQGRAGDSVVSTLGWTPSCRHETLKPQPAVVLDCFGGSGTVGMVANRLSRRAILIDLNPEYLKQQMKRNAQTPLGLSL